VNVTVATCPGKTLWLASTNSIFTLCWPGGSPAMSTVLLSLASAHNLTNVRYWPKADIPSCTAHVRFWGKADMTCCAAYVRF
jgi:hypothetical protein